jgi:hypothetical protein
VNTAYHVSPPPPAGHAQSARRSSAILSRGLLFDRHLPIRCGILTGLASSAIATAARHDLSAVRGKVFLFQNPAVMQFMAGNDVGNCADRDFALVGDAATRPGRFVKIPK